MSRHFRIGLCCATALVALAAGLPRPSLAALEDSQSYITDAKARIAKGDLRGAEIQLRNAERVNPNDASIHVQLAQLYLDLQNLPAAEAEARLARTDKAPSDDVDPLLAKTLLQESKLSELFRDVKPGDRAAKAESQVRVSLGLGHLELREVQQAEPLLRDAERLDEKAAEPKTAMAQLLLAKGDVAGAQMEIDAAGAIAPNDVTVYRVSAEALRARGSVDGAITKLGALLATHPDDVPGLAARADALMNENKLTEAQADIDHALKLSPGNGAIVFLDGVLLSREGKLAEADAQLSKVSDEFNNLPYGYYLEGIVKFKLGQYQQAAAELSKYISRFPNAALPRQLIARIDLARRDYLDAIDVLKPAVDANQSDATSALLLAQAYIASGHRNDALDLYQKAEKAQPHNIEAQANFAALKAGLGQVRGLAELDKLAQTAEGAAVAGPTLVVADLNAGRIADAANTAEALVREKGSKDSITQTLLAAVRMAQGRYADAAEIYKGIVARDPTLPAAQRSLAEADVELGRLDEAKSVLQGLLGRQPSSPEDALALARVEARQGNVVDAAKLLKATQQNSPNDPSPGIALLEIYRDAKEWDKAEAYGRDLEGQFPANASVIDMMAALKFAAGDTKGAAAEYANLVQGSPDSAPILMRYSTYQNAAGDKSGAAASLRRAVALEPRDPGPIEALVAFEIGNNDPNAALAAAQSVGENQPQNSIILAAEVLQRSGRAKEAIALLQQEQKDHPAGKIVAKLGEVLYFVGQRDEAKQVLEAWIKGHDDVAPRVTLATIHLTEHEDDAARSLYEQVYEKAPYDLTTLNNLAVLYEKKHDARALPFAAEAYRLAPGPNTADTLGWVLVGGGRATDGLPLLREASETAPENPSFAYHLAAALSIVGQPGEARSVLERVMRSTDAFDEKAEAQRLLDKLQHS